MTTPISDERLAELVDMLGIDTDFDEHSFLIKRGTLRGVFARIAALTAERDAAVERADAALAERNKAEEWLKMAKSNTADYERVVIAMGERRATAAIVAWLKGCDERACEAAAWAVDRGDHLTAHKPLDT